MENIHINKKETIIAFIITIILAGLDLLGYPAAWFVNVHVLDVNPIYFNSQSMDFDYYWSSGNSLLVP